MKNNNNNKKALLEVQKVENYPCKHNPFSQLGKMTLNLCSLTFRTKVSSLITEDLGDIIVSVWKNPTNRRVLSQDDHFCTFLKNFFF